MGDPGDRVGDDDKVVDRSGDNEDAQGYVLYAFLSPPSTRMTF